MKIRSVTIEKFKRLEQVSFNLDDVNILIGGNNSGKSTIIQAVHFAFTLFQSLNISNQWPARTKKSTTISPSELIYIPSEDPYSLGYGGRLLEEPNKSIVLTFTFDNGQAVCLRVRKGRITNILVEPDNVQFAKTLSRLDSPYTVFSPGLAGVSRTENYVSDGVLLRALARGDANVVLRNILYRLKGKPAWENFEADLSQVFPELTVEVQYDSAVDQYIEISITEAGKSIPLDLAGTGLLQAIQILAYLHLFSPRLIILDEPDSHLHPNNQRLLCSLISTISLERDVQVLITTHSRHVLDTLHNDAKILWVQDGAVVEAGPQAQVEMLLELGALDIKEKIASGRFAAVLLTEDRLTPLLRVLLRNSGFDEERTAILPYNGVTSIHLLRPLVKHIKTLSNAGIFVHRDRDYLYPDEIEQWRTDIRSLGAEPFVTQEIDIEGYFCTESYIRACLKGDSDVQFDDLLSALSEGELDDALTSYVNGRVDIERKAGTIGRLDIGKLSAEASKKISENPLGHMKGKRKLSKLKKILHERYGIRFEVNLKDILPSDPSLAQAAPKYFQRKGEREEETPAATLLRVALFD